MEKKLSIQRELNKQHASSQINSDQDNNLKLIKRELENKYGGSFISFHNSQPVYCICAVDSEDDYYWVGINKDYKLKYFTCCGNPTILKKIPEELYTFNLELKDDPESILKIINEELSKVSDFPFTDIYLGDNVYKYDSV